MPDDPLKGLMDSLDKELKKRGFETERDGDTVTVKSFKQKPPTPKKKPKTVIGGATPSTS